MVITKVVLIRHGESLWNKENRFTGWVDIDLSDKGRKEAKIAGNLLKDKGFIFDLAYTSMLKRAIHTLWSILDQLEQQWLPIKKSWKLNERHYGALQGLNKSETIAKFGNEQVKLWRRSFNISPPCLTKNNLYHPKYDIRYSKLSGNKIPLTESLADTFNRVIPYWKKIIKPNIIAGKKIIITAHGNSLRALIKYLDNINEDEIINLNIPTAFPIIYEFDKNIKPIKRYYLI
ncbi:2,3-bisphosphoglycerate-dependent phosphoglycerate mutase [Candidatus Providencia siddallii]|uniref:2,3-bisphosphoglycerate-dependent phosphoglycerate mutase n=1 Tax=Candidatus Providencia siddallii TaxID=1715285 RepID=A0A0M6W860_9GAMM|nr:2,3-bisphosphoglycerate-dependent phosphoglycerate mutase [Candidatus Providencia siddallii]